MTGLGTCAETPTLASITDLDCGVKCKTKSSSDRCTMRSGIGVTQWSKRSLTWTTVRRWARWHGFPLTPGTRWGGNYMSAITTTHAITAWLLSRPYNGHPMRVFRGRP